MLVSGNPAVLLLAFTMSGIARGAVSNFNNSIINEIATGKGWALNLLHSVFAIGAFIAPFLAMLFTRNNTDGWLYAVLIVAILCAVEVLVLDLCQFQMISQLKEIKILAKAKTDWGFLKNKYYLTACGIMFSICVQNKQLMVD